MQGREGCGCWSQQACMACRGPGGSHCSTPHYTPTLLLPNRKPCPPLPPLAHRPPCLIANHNNYGGSISSPSNTWMRLRAYTPQEMVKQVRKRKAGAHKARAHSPASLATNHLVALVGLHAAEVVQQMCKSVVGHRQHARSLRMWFTFCAPVCAGVCAGVCAADHPLTRVEVG